MIKRIILKKGEEQRILCGHPWVYDNEVEAVVAGKGGQSAEIVPGECVDVESFNKHYMGRAFGNPASKIVARIYSPSKEGADEGFFKRRIREAVERRALTGTDVSCRLVFAEADFLPGLIIDRFVGWNYDDVSPLDLPLTPIHVREKCGPPCSYLAVQILSAGIEARRELVYAALRETLPWLLDAPAGIVEKSPAGVREIEGLPPREGLVEGNFPAAGIVIFENGFPFIVDLIGGQKTGHFLDQRENHRVAARVTPAGGRVLDAFSYSGGFAIHAAHAGAGRVIAVDVSKNALELGKRNAILNGVSDSISTMEADVFDVLVRFERTKERFDMIILDPPAFAKSHAARANAVKGYNEINYRALKLINPGGILVTCSCSFAFREEHFKKVIVSAAGDAGRRLIELDFRAQASCHPVLVGYDESHYLKCGIYRVIR
ncbi:MAG: class I SAM-dependent rRNA methyltransferase [Spirochaetaceae bacterium]|jgi:23S rRNA (cytosine1962-C5)-methyltransferase|nr:class I SAM-dependent rRNA methyltransferase [Spirochaetaceae bacterium]